MRYVVSNMINSLKIQKISWQIIESLNFGCDFVKSSAPLWFTVDFYQFWKSVFFKIYFFDLRTLIEYFKKILIKVKWIRTKFTPSEFISTYCFILTITIRILWPRHSLVSEGGLPTTVIAQSNCVKTKYWINH